MSEVDKDWLINEYVKIHEKETIYLGEFTEYHGLKIQNLINQFNCQTILDYGSGKGEQYKFDKIHLKYFNGILPTLYDPAVKGIDILPNDNFDLVVCTDVLEHIPENLLKNLLEEIFSKAKSCVYLGINNSKAETKLSDGRDVHITRQRGTWWINKIKPYCDKLTVLHVYGQLGMCDAILENHQLKEMPVFIDNDRRIVK